MNPVYFSEAAYQMASSGNKAKRVARTQAHIDKVGNSEKWVVVPDHSNKNIVTFKSGDGRIHIAHRGTDVNRGKDIKADMALSAGKEGDNKKFKKRVRNTVKAVKAFPDSEVSMSGHSLGGSTAYYSVVSNKLIGDRVKRLDTYNLGRSPFQSLKIADKRKAMLAAKITHHRTKGDAVSASVMINKPIGRIKSYAAKCGKACKVKSLAAKAAGFGMTYKALHNHTLEHFK